MKKEICLPWGYKYIAAFLTMRCNLNCGYCLNAFGKAFDRKGFREAEGKEWINALNKINSREEVPVTFSGGEPSIHKDFVYIVKNLRPELNIDILTNLKWHSGWERFIHEITPERMRRESPYPSIRVSYHPSQMNAGEVIGNARRMVDAGFSVGIYAVQYPSPQQLEAITEMQFLCKTAGIEFRVKDFTGKFEGIDDSGRKFSITYGNYSKYPEACFSETRKKCECKTSELLIAPDCRVYRCHRDLFAEENPAGSLLDGDFEIRDTFRACGNYGNCHPCDVKVKTDYRQNTGHTSVEIKHTDNCIT